MQAGLIYTLKPHTLLYKICFCIVRQMRVLPLVIAVSASKADCDKAVCTVVLFLSWKSLGVLVAASFLNGPTVCSMLSSSRGFNHYTSSTVWCRQSNTMLRWLHVSHDTGNCLPYAPPKTHRRFTLRKWSKACCIELPPSEHWARKSGYSTGRC